MDMISDLNPITQEWLEAVERDDKSFVLDRLRRGMNVNVGNCLNATALMVAVHDRNYEMIRLLLDHGADANLENDLGHTAMTFALIQSRTWENDYWRVSNPNPEALSILLTAGGKYRLYEAVLLNDLALARDRLDEGADANTGTGTYHGPLLKIAAELGYLEIVDLLLDRGADIEAMDDLGQRPLLSAARYGQAEVASLLLDRGAEIDAVDWSGQTALSNAAIEDHDRLFAMLLARGARRGIVDALARSETALFETLLDDELRGGSDLNSLSDGIDPLAILAARRGNVEIVRLLLDRGVGFWSEGDDRILLAYAARSGSVDVIRLLIDRVPDLGAVGTDGMTLLAWAVREGHAEVALLLRNAGASH